MEKVFAKRWSDLEEAITIAHLLVVVGWSSARQRGRRREFRSESPGWKRNTSEKPSVPPISFTSSLMIREEDEDEEVVEIIVA